MSNKTHYRLCHICGTANSAYGQLVKVCETCGKHLAPFYFFDESRAMGIDNSNFCSSVREASATLLPHSEYPPVTGLTVYWES